MFIPRIRLKIDSQAFCHTRQKRIYTGNKMNDTHQFVLLMCLAANTENCFPFIVMTVALTLQGHLVQQWLFPQVRLAEKKFFYLMPDVFKSNL
ncbi:hypothetical protein XELAEV_18000303mg [Xenopus laevis]|uniref:Uncharacterized protein n=1 Tax=Xenopus laevis TaxID=8355 RepID=A0A974BQL6_XENLA|nr:hypothetical protein XELAEV_18000303mg [Xenopus laevis]